MALDGDHFQLTVSEIICRDRVYDRLFICITSTILYCQLIGLLICCLLLQAKGIDCKKIPISQGVSCS